MFKKIFAYVMIIGFVFLQTAFCKEISQRGKILDSHGNVLTLSPVGGYVTKKNQKEIYIGRRGLQAQYNSRLSIGVNLHTTIDMNFQEAIEKIMDEMKRELNATEVLGMVMDSQTGKLNAIASSNRYDPEHITQSDIPSIKPKFSEYLFEPGSVMKPVTLALALYKGYVTSETMIDTHDGKFKIGKYSILDDKGFEQLSATDVIVNSSNIGISEIAWKLSGEEFRDGLLKFGFGSKSGIDLPIDLNGTVKDATMLEHKLHRASTAYGYGMRATPVQLLKAYSTFANKGMMLTPHVAVDFKSNPQRVVSEKTAEAMKQILMENVSRGMGKNAQTRGLIIGGKTGMAHIAKNGKYTDSYNSSFFGFVEDKEGHSYTIGVLAIDPKKKYFASQSAVPVFREIVESMVKEKLLVPKAESITIKKVSESQVDMDLMNQRLGLINTDKKMVNYIGKKTIYPIIGARVVKPFGVYIDPDYRIKIFNESVSFTAANPSAAVYNIFDGKVVYVGKSTVLGKVVVMAHKNNLHTVYAGLSKIPPTVKRGRKLQRAYVLGRVDKTLVFQVIQDGKIIDPMEVIGKVLGGGQ